MSKRRRASSGASRADGDDSDELSNPGPPPSSRKRKKLDPVSLMFIIPQFFTVPFLVISTNYEPVILISYYCKE